MVTKIIDVFKGNAEGPPPIWMMRQAGRHLPEYRAVRETTSSFIDFCFSPKKAAEVTLQPVKRYDMDAAILFADILLIPIGLGRNVNFVPGVGPVLEPITVTDIGKLKVKGAESRISSVFETVQRVRTDLDAKKALIGFCGGPWTVATYMIEGKGSATKEVAKRFAYENPGAIDDLLDALAVSSAQYLIGQANAGADILKIFESWAEGLSPPLFEKLIIRPTIKIVEIVRAAGVDVPIIGFPRGSGLNVSAYLNKVAVQGIAAGTDMPLQRLRELAGQKMVVQGNLDPLALRIGGEALKVAVDQVISSAEGPYVFNLGHGVAPDVKIENVHAIINHVRTGVGDYV